jgi:hypothetical protein
VDLDILLLVQSVDVEINVSGPDPETDAVVAFLWQVQEIHFGILVEAEVVPMTEIDLNSAVRCAQPVALGDGHVDRGILVAQVRGSLQEGFAFEKTHPGDGIIGISDRFLALGRRLWLGLSLVRARGLADCQNSQDWNRQCYEKSDLPHGFSPRCHTSKKYAIYLL